mmetsp:Transcript_23815/g.62340  ORF Transcript_23815/g.62340 Transcript_23815/m.62340 type:complete len:205 (-) Transcript_23815:22-636(-)
MHIWQDVRSTEKREGDPGWSNCRGFDSEDTSHRLPDRLESRVPKQCDKREKTTNGAEVLAHFPSLRAAVAVAKGVRNPSGDPHAAECGSQRRKAQPRQQHRHVDYREILESLLMSPLDTIEFLRVLVAVWSVEVRVFDVILLSGRNNLKDLKHVDGDRRKRYRHDVPIFLWDGECHRRSPQVSFLSSESRTSSEVWSRLSRMWN